MQAAQAARFDWSHALLNRREKKSNRAPARCCRGWICDTAAGFSVNNSRAAYTCLCAQLRQAKGRSLTMQYHRHGLTGHIDFGHQRCRVHGYWHARRSDSAPEKPAKAIAKASGISIKKTISAHRPKERLEISPHTSLRKIVFCARKGQSLTMLAQLSSHLPYCRQNRKNRALWTRLKRKRPPIQSEQAAKQTECARLVLFLLRWHQIGDRALKHFRCEIHGLGQGRMSMNCVTKVHSIRAHLDGKTHFGN